MKAAVRLKPQFPDWSLLKLSWSICQGIIVKLSSGFSRPWFLMYSSIVFWFTSLTVPQKYPRPQYLFFIMGYSSCKIVAIFPSGTAWFDWVTVLLDRKAAYVHDSFPHSPVRFGCYLSHSPAAAIPVAWSLLPSLALDNDILLSIQNDILSHTLYGFLSGTLPVFSPRYQYTTFPP